MMKNEHLQRKTGRGPFFAMAVGIAALVAGTGYALRSAAAPPENTGNKMLTGKAALGDWTTDAPGVRRRITVADLAAPYETPSVDNGPRMIPRPEGAWPKAPRGFTVEQYAADLENPRVIVTAPNGDVFVAESRPGQVKVLRDANGDGKPEVRSLFASGLRRHFGIAFYPPGPQPRWVYVANTDSVVRFPYRNGDLKARGPEEMIVNNISGGGQLRGGGHWTRDIAFSRDGRRMYASVGSLSNVMERPQLEPAEARRARIFEYRLGSDGRTVENSERVFAWGIRNAVGIAVHPRTGQIWASVNERDGLGDHLVPDYVTSVREGGFYGWPWFYMGGHQDPRHPGARPDLRNKVIVPDVLLQSHSASLAMTFYTGAQFPREYLHDGFAAQHGSWNRSRRTGYKVTRIPLRDGKATGEYEDFLVGFVTPEGNVWGRPVGVTVDRSGALLVSDDGGNCIWRVRYGSQRASRR